MPGPPPTARVGTAIGQTELDETRQGLGRAVAVGAPAFLAFYPLDLFVRATLHPETSLAWVTLARLAGGLVLVAAWFFIRRPGWSLRGLLAFTTFGLSLGLVSLALLAVGFGGLDSSYLFTPAYYAVAVGTFLPAHWRQSLFVIVPSISTFFATLVIGVAASPALAWQLSDPIVLARFAQNTLLVLGIIVFAALAGHVLWRVRTRLRDARRLGRYLLRAPLGQGGMNEVWLAWDMTLKREVALKLLHAQRRGDARMARFEREALATSRLHSPHTIRIFDFGTNDDGTAWIAMEYLRGQDLDGMVATYGPIAPRRAVHFARQAAASLAEAHAAGVVHRDIKPANLMCLASGGPADVLKVLDFGIARQLDATDAPLTLIGVVIGTPAFMAPEVLAGQAADPRSDVWSFGATLYTLLVGRLPYEDAGRPYGALARGPVAPPSERLEAPLPPGLDALVAACMAPAPEDRPADGQALVAALDALAVPPWTSAEAELWWSERRTAADHPAPAAAL